MGRVERLVGALEQLQVPLAQVREAMGIEGMDVQTALNVRDKPRMKEVLRAAGRAVRTARAGARRGAGRELRRPRSASRWWRSRRRARAPRRTYRLDDVAALDGWLGAVPPTGEDPALLEEFLVGEEHTFDSVTMGGTTVWSSIADYHPPPLEVLRNPWIQWTVLLPRDISGPEYAGIREVGPAALRALGVHRRAHAHGVVPPPDGSVAVSEVAARPPGAQLTSMHGYVHDFDLYARWARAGRARLVRRRPSDASPPARRTCAGWAGGGCGRCTGSTRCNRQVGHLVVESRLPRRTGRQRGRHGLHGRGPRHGRATPSTEPWCATPCDRDRRAGSGVELDGGRM